MLHAPPAPVPVVVELVLVVVVAVVELVLVVLVLVVAPVVEPVLVVVIDPPAPPIPEPELVAGLPPDVGPPDAAEKRPVEEDDPHAPLMLPASATTPANAAALMKVFMLPRSSPRPPLVSRLFPSLPSPAPSRS
jgi:hypothetical protein